MFIVGGRAGEDAGAHHKPTNRFALVPISPQGDGAMFNRLLKHESGQDLVEYLLVGSFIAIVALIGATNFGTQINGWFQSFANWATAD
jgi:Flp pilus assembly pilin Flp